MRYVGYDFFILESKGSLYAKLICVGLDEFTSFWTCSLKAYSLMQSDFRRLLVAGLGNLSSSFYSDYTSAIILE